MAILKNTRITSGSSGNLRIPVGTTAQRPGSPNPGNVRINTDKSILEIHKSGSIWNNESSWVVTTGNRTSPSFTPRVLIQAESVGLNNFNTGRRQFIQINGTTVVNADTPRSYRVTKLIKNSFNGQWELSASNGYDVYASTAEGTNLLNFLNTFREGEMMILTTFDEPFTTLGVSNDTTGRLIFTNTLRDNFASNILGYRWQWNSRDMHLLVSFRGATAPLFEDHRPSPEGGITTSIWLP
jgi:hypothetical protein